MTISERSLEFLSENFFLNEFIKEQILRKAFDLMEMTVFVQTSEMGQALPNMLLLKMCHIQLN